VPESCEASCWSPVQQSPALAMPIIVEAQSPATISLQFDVASIKPNSSGANISSLRIAPGGRLTGTTFHSNAAHIGVPGA